MKEKKYLILGIATVLITLIGVTYAYFTTRIIGDRKNVTVDMAELKIIFTNGDAIEASDVYAEDNLDIVKTFSVENKTKNEYKYNIVIEDLVNSFKTTGYLVYKITSDDGGYNMTEFEDVPKRSSASDTVLTYSVSIPAKSIHNYNIEIKYINDEENNQDEDQGATLSGKLYIGKGTDKPLNLAEAILRNNTTISERTSFSSTNVSNTTGTLFKTNKTEDGSDVYYYSGNTTNNWVKFGKYQNDLIRYRGYSSSSSTLYYMEYNTMDECTSATSCNINCTEYKYANVGDDIYWRIVRTNEDGSVRILYSGTSHDTTTGYIGSSTFNTSYNDPMYVGYMYGTSGSLENNRTNTNDSTIKTYIDNWYESNLLTNYDKYISKTAIYCNDRSVGSGTYSTSSFFYYGAYTRLNTNKTPTYKCGGNISDGLFESTQSIEDKFSASTEGGGNGQLTYPIALMTVDEISFAGGTNGTSLSSPYAWYYTNSVGNSILDNEYWWLLSPNFWNSIISGMFHVNGSYNQGLLSNRSVYSWDAVRPTISLSSCVRIKSGNGTPESPYEIDYDGSCN